MNKPQSSLPTASGRVWAHVGQPLDQREFDVVVIGAGRMGAALTLYLRQLAPQLSTLIIEEGGLPNEEGASILAPGIWTTLNLPAEQRAKASWTRQQLEHSPPDVQWQPRPLVEVSRQESPGSLQTCAALAEFPDTLALIDSEAWPFARLDPQAATYRPGNAALNAAQQAIKLGANLLLNTRARPTSGGVQIERLTVTNTHQIVTHETLFLRANVIIIAAGAGGPALAEHELGVHTAHGKVYQQYPRLEHHTTDHTPVLRAGPLTLRPQHGSYVLICAPHSRDPHGYQPTAGHLTGVQTGLRREVLEDLVNLLEAVPVLAAEGLQLGHSLSDIPGTWVSLPGGKVGGFPLWENLTDDIFLLVGGPYADTLGLATAYELAQHIAQSGYTPGSSTETDK